VQYFFIHLQTANDGIAQNVISARTVAKMTSANNKTEFQQTPDVVYNTSIQ